MIGVYFAYVIFMMFNAKIEAKHTKTPAEAPVPEEVPMQENTKRNPLANKWSMAAKAATAHMHFHTRTILGLTTQNPEATDGVEGSAGGVVAAYAIARFYAIRRRGGPPGAQATAGGGNEVVRKYNFAFED